MEPPSSRSGIIYPDTDGAPIAENTLQYEWVVKIKGGLDGLLAANPDAFVAADLFWYPVEGHPEIVAAPDAMVAFGRPKGHRLSYLQWEEGGVPPQVVFEVLSPGNRPGEMVRKLEFYQRYGVEEYYLYDPDLRRPALSGFLRRDDRLAEISPMNGHVSPRLGVRFDVTDGGLTIIRPDGEPFVTFNELHRREAEQRRIAEQERSRAEEAVSEVERLRERLRSLGQDAG